MNITPDRALELAGKAECGALDSDPYRRDDFDEIAEILRHYAEIAPKWQAVLDAEVVARRITAPDGHTSLHKGSAVSDGCFTQIGHEVAHLIIKPAP